MAALLLASGVVGLKAELEDLGPIGRADRKPVMPVGRGPQGSLRASL